MKLNLAIIALCMTLSTHVSASIMKANHLNEPEDRPEIMQVDIPQLIVSIPIKYIAKIDNDEIKSNLISTFNRDIKSLCSGNILKTNKCRVNKTTTKHTNTALYAPN